MVDQYTGFDAANDLRDGVHPNAAGDTKMAAKWYPALVQAIDSVTQGTEESKSGQNGKREVEFVA